MAIMRRFLLRSVLPSCVACLAYSLVTHGASAVNLLSGSITSVPLELHSPNEPALIAKINGVAIPLSFDLGDGASLSLQQSALDEIGAVPTGTSIQQQGIDGFFSVPTYKILRV